MWQGFFRNQEVADIGISASEQFRVSTYGYFSFWHVVMIFIAIIIVGICAILFFRKKHIEQAVLITTSAIVCTSMLALLIWSIATGEYNIEWFVPLHICNVFGIILPICCVSKKFKKFILDYVVWMGIGGGIVAIVFPITSMVHMGVFHPTSIMVWVHHVALAALGVYYVCSGIYRRINVFPMLGIFTFLIGTGAIVNHFTGSNFLFTNPDRLVQPMYGMVAIFGRWGVLVVIAKIYAIFIAIHFVYRWFERRRHLTVRQFVTESWFVRKVIKSKLISEVITFTTKKVKSTATGINNKIKNKTARKAILLTERFVNCIKTSNILIKLYDTELASLTDADYLIETFNKSGLIEKLATEFSLQELNELKSLPMDEIYLLPAGTN